MRYDMVWTRVVEIVVEMEKSGCIRKVFRKLKQHYELDPCSGMPGLKPSFATS